MNGFSAADMSTAAANGHAEGYQAGYADAVKAYEAGKSAAAQEAVAWFTDDHLTDRSATTYDAAVAERWRAKGWPVTPLYAAPVAAAPGIDLLNTSYFQGWACAANWAGRADLVSDVGSGAYIRERDARLRSLIDASPKGGGVDNVTRSAFQRWAVSQNLSVQRSEFHLGMAGDYVDRATSHAWEAWQAAMQATSAEVGS